MSRPAYLWFLFLMSSFSLLFASGKQQQRESSSPVPLEFPEDSQESNQGEKTFTDALGHTIYLKQPPDRIASSALFCDEILLGLIPLEKIIALSTLAGNQAYSNVYYQAMEIDVHLDFQVEPLIELNPDIIFCADWSDASKVKQLRSAGIGVFQIKTPRSMKEIRETVLLLGKILSAEEQAEQIIKTMDEMLLRIDAVVDTIPQENRLTALDYNSWGASFGDSSTWNEILDYGGIINAASSLEQDLFGQVPMTRELLVEIDPDIIFLPGWVYGDPKGAEDFLEQIMSDPALANLRAIQNERVYLIPEYYKSTSSQYIVEAVRYVSQLVYPEYYQ